MPCKEVLRSDLGHFNSQLGLKPETAVIFLLLALDYAQPQCKWKVRLSNIKTSGCPEREKEKRRTKKHSVSILALVKYSNLTLMLGKYFILCGPKYNFNEITLGSMLLRKNITHKNRNKKQNKAIKLE